MDGIVDKEGYLEKKNSLVVEEQALKEQLLKHDTYGNETFSDLEKFLELANSAYLSYRVARPEERRDLVKIITSNFETDGKSVSIKLQNPFQIIAEREAVTDGSPCRETARTVPALLSQLLKLLEKSDLVQPKTDFGLLP
jgi:hypothetical protein